MLMCQLTIIITITTLALSKLKQGFNFFSLIAFKYFLLMNMKLVMEMIILFKHDS